MEILHTVAGSWPIAAMVIAMMVVGVIYYLIWKMHRAERDRVRDNLNSELDELRRRRIEHRGP